MAENLMGAIKDAIGGTTGNMKTFLSGLADEGDKIKVGRIEDGAQLTDADNDKYRNAIKNGEKFKKQKFEKGAKRFIDYMRSLPDKDALKNADPYDLFCNEFWANVQTIMPMLYFQNPEVSLEADEDNFTVMVDVPDINNPGAMTQVPKILVGTQAAELLENIVNKQYKLINWKKIARRCTRDECVVGLGWAKFGWKAKIRRSESNDLQLIKDEMTCERLNPFNVNVDPECVNPDLSDAKFLDFVYIKPTSEIKKNPAYKGVKNLKGSTKLKFSAISEKTQKEEGNDYFGEQLDLERNKVHELWFISDRKVITYLDDSPTPIRIDDWLFGLEGYPTAPLITNEDPEWFYPIPDFKAYESVVLLKTKLRRKMAELFKSLNRSFLVDDGIDKNEFQAMLDCPTGGVVKVKNPEKKDLSALIRNVNDFVMSESYMALEEIFDADIQKYSGITDYQKGLISSAKRTASELLTLSSTQNQRIDFKKDAIVDWMEVCTRIMINLLQANQTKQKVIIIKTDKGPQQKLWDRYDIQGRYTISIDVGSMVKQNPETKQKFALARYDKFVQNPLVDQVELAKDTLKALGEKNPEKKLNAKQVAMYQAPAPIAIPGANLPPMGQNKPGAAPPATPMNIPPAEAAAGQPTSGEVVKTMQGANLG